MENAWKHGSDVGRQMAVSSLNQWSPAAVKRHTAWLPTVGLIVLWLNLVPSYVNLEFCVEENWSGLPPSPSLSN